MALTRRQIVELGNAMAERRRALLEEIEDGLAHARAESGGEAQAEQIEELCLADVRRDLGELEELDAARRRLSEGGYGVCLECGADIAVERLRAQPGAPRCVDCQRQRERTYRT